MGFICLPETSIALSIIAGRLEKNYVVKESRGTEARRLIISNCSPPPQRTDADAKNFVLCPGKVFDRSPCGTGTSAKIACLVASGHFREGQIWKQEGIIGSLFEAWVTVEAGQIFPSIRGSAYVTAETTLIIDPEDPYRMGIN